MLFIYTEVMDNIFRSAASRQKPGIISVTSELQMTAACLGRDHLRRCQAALPCPGRIGVDNRGGECALQKISTVSPLSLSLLGEENCPVQF